MALLLRDAGAPDEAIRRLERLAGDCPDVERPKVFKSLAITYQVVGVIGTRRKRSVKRGKSGSWLTTIGPI